MKEKSPVPQLCTRTRHLFMLSNGQDHPSPLCDPGTHDESQVSMCERHSSHRLPPIGLDQPTWMSPFTQIKCHTVLGYILTLGSLSLLFCSFTRGFCLFRAQVSLRWLFLFLNKSVNGFDRDHIEAKHCCGCADILTRLSSRL